MTEVKTLYEGGSFFEGPRWHDGRWWVSDFFDKTVWTLTAEGQAQKMLTVEGMPSGLGWMPDGSLLVVSMTDQKLLRRSPTGEMSVHADIAEYCRGWANDMVVDARGNSYVGNFGFDVGMDVAPTNVVHVAPDGTASVGAADLLTPNGSVITPDGGTLIVGETVAGRYTAFSIADDGSLSDRRIWTELSDPPVLGPLEKMLEQQEFAPDGCALDAEDHIWSADIGGARCARVSPEGVIVEEIRPPDGLVPFACMLGGEDGRTLLMCAAPDGAYLEPAHDAVLLTATVNVPHAGLP